MNKPNDANEPSLASDGSQPVAWAVVQSECWSVYLTRLDANRAATHGLGELVPLYRATQPLLTDAEREAIEECVNFAFPASHPTATTLRNLLQRTK
jgi:hypothetical protein